MTLDLYPNTYIRENTRTNAHEFYYGKYKDDTIDINTIYP